MGLISNVVNAAKNTYNYVDKNVAKGYLPGGTTPQQVSNTRQNQNQNNVDETQRSALSPITTPTQSSLTSAINRGSSSGSSSSSSFTTPQQKTSLSNPTPSATTGMSINPLTGGIIPSSSNSGGDRTLINTPLPQTSLSNPTPTATTGMTLNPITGSLLPESKYVNTFQPGAFKTPSEKISLAVYGDTGYIGSGGSINPWARNQEPFLNRYEAGAEGGFINRISDWWNTGVFPVGKQVGEDIYLPRTNLGGTRTDIGFGINGSSFISPTPEKETLKQRAVNEYVIKDIGTPIEFKIQDLKKSVEQDYLKDINKYFSGKQEERKSQDVLLQTRIDKGEITVSSAKALQEGQIYFAGLDIEKYQKESGLKYQGSFNIKAQDLISLDTSTRKQVMSNLESARGRVDIVPIIETTAFIAAPIIGGSIAVGSSAASLGIKGSIESLPNIARYGSEIGNIATMGIIGTKDITQGMYRGDILQTGIGIGAIGLSGLGLTSTGFKSAGQLSNLEFQQKGLAQQSFTPFIKEQYPLFELREIGGKIDTSQIVGMRSFGDLKQVAYSKGDIIKQGEQFIMPSGKLNTITTGTIKGSEGYTFGSELTPKAYAGFQEFDIGSKGFTFKFGEQPGRSLTIGSGTLVPKFETYGLSDISQINKKIKPSEYLNMLESKNEILVVRPSSEQYFNMEIGKIEPSAKALYSKSDFLNLPETKGVILLREGASEKEIGHELAHYFTEGKYNTALEKGIDYWKRPSEVYAMKMGDVYAKEGISFKSFGFNKESMKSQFKSNIKLFEGTEFSKTGIGGVTQKIGKNVYASRIGEVTGIEFNPGKEFNIVNGGNIKISQDLKVNLNLKDYMFTKTSKKQGAISSFDIISGERNEQGLKQLNQFKSPKLESGIVTQGLVNEFKTELVPSFKGTQNSLMKSSSVFSGMGSSFSGLKTRTTGKSRYADLSSVYISPSSLSGLSSSSNSKLASSSFISPKVKGFQDVGFKQLTSLTTPQLTKTDLGLTPINFTNIGPGFTPGPFNFKGFDMGFPGIPELGGGLGYAPRKPKKSKRSKTKVKPSFTASVFDIKTGLPKSGKFGISPFKIRGLPKGSKSFNIGI